MTRNIRPIRIEGKIAYVPLTQGYEAIIDAADVHMVDGWNWYAMVLTNTVYVARNSHRDANGNRNTILLHRVIIGCPDGLDVDHRDADGLNNRRCNLREATHAQNMRNRRIQADNTSGFKGASWHKNSGKWQAKISIDGKEHHLGLHPTPEEAHAAYASASARLHGEFGRTE
jgi:hypothetical protein